MRSVRKAPPPPRPHPDSAAAAAATAPVMPDAPGFDPEKKFGTGKRRAPAPPPVQPGYQPAPQSYAAPPPRYNDLRFQAAAAEEPPLQRGGPPRVSNEFTAQLNQAMVGRRWPSESEI